MIGKSPHIMLCPQMCRILRLLGSGADAHASKTHFTVWKYQDFDIQIYVKLILEDVEISTVVFAIFGDLNVGVLINSESLNVIMADLVHLKSPKSISRKI